jgi:pimeloyl-ACP methyl ester carboxylesterase
VPELDVEETMAAYLLIHGAWHGAWCWDKTAAALRAAGHDVTAIDLPSHGDDPTPAAEVTLDSYVERIGQALETIDGPAIAVGHSMGGIAITAAAEAFPDQIAKLVYLTAFLPRNGESLLALEGRNPKPSVPPALIISETEPTATLQDDLIVPLFFHDCTPQDQQMAKGRLTPQSLAPMSTELVLTPERFGSIQRIYIECTDDRAISLELQRDMHGTSGVHAVLSLDASHSPFLSMPEALADQLASLA